MRSRSARKQQGRAPAVLPVAMLAAVVASVLIVIFAVTSRTSDAAGGAAPAYDSATTQFFTRYLAADGRVSRRDQGGDTVSEGQAYGMLLALYAGDRDRFALIWTWTRRHLQRADGLLAYRWRAGRIADRDPAADADLDVSVALLRAAERWHDAGFRRAGVRIAKAVLDRESVAAAPGRLITAGPWAVANPAVLNPSYVVAGTAGYLEGVTGDRRWREVARATAVVQRTLATSAELPPDWAQLAAGRPASAVAAAAAPDGSSPRYGLDAPRLVIRLATSCSAADRALAARFATRLGEPGAVGQRSLTGAALVDWRNALTDVALYAARRAAGDRVGSETARTAAAALDHDYPTYYGGAWLALAPNMFAATRKACS